MSFLEIFRAAKKAELSKSSNHVKDVVSDVASEVASLVAQMQNIALQCGPADIHPQVPVDCDDCMERQDCMECESVSMAACSRARTPLEQARLTIGCETGDFGGLKSAAASYASVVNRHFLTPEGRLAMMKAYEDAITSEEFAQLRTEYCADDAGIVGFLLGMHRLVDEECHPEA